MGAFVEGISSAFHTFLSVFSGFDSIVDVLDVLLVTFMIYGIITQIRRTQSIQAMKGIGLIFLIYIVVVGFNMSASKRIFNSLVSNILLVFVILFNTEIRQFLATMGQSRWRNFSIVNLMSSEPVVLDAINATCRACDSMSEDKIGSLIVFQRKTMLGDLEKTGVPIDCVTTTEMLCSIFFPKAALHDGAIIIKDGRIVAARCIVPLKNDHVVKEKVGTRHRAALEVSRGGDAIAVVTSEETGIISIAVDGQLIRGITDGELREKLSAFLLPPADADNTVPQKIRRIFKGGSVRK